MRSNLTLLLMLISIGVIHAQDLTPPTVKAKTGITINLGSEGTATLHPDQVDIGSIDNITSSSNLKYSLSKTSFSCEDLAAAEEWQLVGGAAVSMGGTTDPSLAISLDGTLFVAYSDYSLEGSPASVMKWNGSSWEHLKGGSLFGGGAYPVSLAVSPYGTPYVAFIDIENEYKTTVLQWSGSSWETLGGAGISLGEAENQSLAISPDGTPYVAYRDIANNGITAVLKWTGSSWEALGEAGSSTEYTYFQSLAIAPDGTPYVAYRDEPNGAKTTVMKWTGSSWEALGGAGISEGSAFYQSLAIAPDGTPYVAYQDEENGYKATVLKWTGSSWEALGGAGISSGSAAGESLAVSPDGTPYVAFWSTNSATKATVLKWTGSSWDALDGADGAGIPADPTWFLSLAISPDGTPYVAYPSEVTNNNKTEVQKYHHSNRVTLTVEDEAGNKAIAGTLVHVEDTLLPLEITNTGIEIGSEGSSLITAASLEFSDNCSSANDIRYSITVPPHTGRIELVSAPETPIDSFTQQQVNNEEIRYITTDKSQILDSFTFKVIDGNGNSAENQRIELRQESLTALLGKEQTTSSLLVYPNPTTGRIEIEKQEALGGQNVTISLSDPGGRLLFRHTGSLEEDVEKVGIYLEKAMEGVYFLSLKTRNQLKTVRLIKK